MIVRIVSRVMGICSNAVNKIIKKLKKPAAMIAKDSLEGRKFHHNGMGTIKGEFLRSPLKPCRVRAVQIGLKLRKPANAPAKNEV